MGLYSTESVMNFGDVIGLILFVSLIAILIRSLNADRGSNYNGDE